MSSASAAEGLRHVVRRHLVLSARITLDLTVTGPVAATWLDHRRVSKVKKTAVKPDAFVDEASVGATVERVWR